ncbi:MAG: UbiD family decarboxylase, partial [Planctomycetales bacterium]|nr:UbiD family decarboxylase [Planctomycetales bacterium]
MNYRSLRHCLDDLLRHQQLVRIETPIDARLEAAALHRRVHAAGGPALWFTQVKGCQFSMASNLFGTPDRARFLFRGTLDSVRRLIAAKIDPGAALRRPWQTARALPAAWHARPKMVKTGPLLDAETSLDQLPPQVSWPHDGGPFVTLPIVHTEDVRRPGWQGSNLGMYRIQLAGNDYDPEREVGLHYQIHRGIGVHHAAAQAAGKPLQVNVYLGGPPSLTLAAVMPLPEGMTELAFAGVLGGRRVRLAPQPGGLPLCVDADFCLSGEVDPDRLLPEGPFGDHLGYYSL